VAKNIRDSDELDAYDWNREAIKKLKFLKDRGRKKKWYHYKFSAEYTYDAIRFFYVARHRLFPIQLEVYEPDTYGNAGGTEVVIRSSLTKKQIIQVLQAIEDSHYIEATLKLVKEYSYK
jgi:hypothetical protein